MRKSSAIFFTLAVVAAFVVAASIPLGAMTGDFCFEAYVSSVDGCGTTYDYCMDNCRNNPQMPGDCAGDCQAQRDICVSDAHAMYVMCKYEEPNPSGGSACNAYSGATCNQCCWMAYEACNEIGTDPNCFPEEQACNNTCGD